MGLIEGYTGIMAKKMETTVFFLLPQAKLLFRV